MDCLIPKKEDTMKLKHVFFAILFVATFGISNAQIVVKVKPAAPAKAVIIANGRAPQGHVWIPGHWVVKGNSYIWRDGFYTKNKPGFRYREGYWVKKRQGWVYIPGKWHKI